MGALPLAGANALVPAPDGGPERRRLVVRAHPQRHLPADSAWRSLRLLLEAAGAGPAGLIARDPDAA